MECLNILEIAEAVGGCILNFTKNIEITNVRTNSKEEVQNSLFVPIVGERVDAHNFIEDAYYHGAVACFVSKEVQRIEGVTYIKVDDTLEALQRLGTYYRNKFSLPVIGITGSVGKTTTKEMVHAALSLKYNVLKTIGNMNSQVGLPLMMFYLEKDHDIAVFEMGISEFCEMERLTKISQPTSAIMTNIGVSHIAQLKTRENILIEKAKIANAFTNKSKLYVCSDDPLLSKLHSKKVNDTDTKNTKNDDMIVLSVETSERLVKSQMISYGLNDKAQFYATNIKVMNEKTYFTLHGLVDGVVLEEDMVLNVLGNHNVSNALVAMAVAIEHKVPFELAKAGLEAYAPIAMRGQIFEKNGMKFIDDSYNASPDSMKSGVNVLLSLESVHRRIAVLADVRELGEASKDLHYQVGTYIGAVGVDILVTVGTQAKYIALGVEATNSRIKTHSFDNNEEAIEFLRSELNAGDGILVKGSRGMKTEMIIQAFCND